MVEYRRITNSIHLWRQTAAEGPEKVLDQLHLQNQPQNSEWKPDTESHHQSCQKGQNELHSEWQEEDFINHLAKTWYQQVHLFGNDAL